METAGKSEAFIVCPRFQSVEWQQWQACSYADAVAVFRFRLSNTILSGNKINQLQPEEINRAQRFHREEDRNRYIHTKCIMRILTGRYTHQNPNEVCFISGINQKPEIKGNTDWHINVSHSGSWIVATIGKRRVGIDVEEIKPAFTFQELLSSSFSEFEQQHIRAGSDPRFLFYKLWTRKEALVKATAKGLDDDFSRFSALDGLQTTQRQFIGAGGSWTVRSFMVAHNYPAAVAYETREEQPMFYTLDSGLFA